MKLPEGHYPLGRFSFVISLLFALRLGLLQLQQKNTSNCSHGSVSSSVSGAVSKNLSILRMMKVSATMLKVIQAPPRLWQ